MQENTSYHRSEVKLTVMELALLILNNPRITETLFLDRKVAVELLKCNFSRILRTTNEIPQVDVLSPEVIKALNLPWFWM